MITSLKKLSTRIAIIHNIPKVFFKNIEDATFFGDHLFPKWEKNVFARTDLRKKFELVYNKFKALTNKRDRDRIVHTFTSVNEIEKLCNNTPGITVYELKDLPSSIHEELDKLFEYLYKTAINYHGFESYVKDSVHESINRFNKKNELEVCPFCGLEGFLNLEGQARLALDHWLCRDLFPMSAVNFNNLIPIGPACNARPAKGSKNILIDNPTSKARVIAYYPYLQHSGITTQFKFVNEPTISTFGKIPDSDWNLTLSPVDPTENDIYTSWISTMNIEPRYLDYIRINILNMWESRYKKFIEKHPRLKHAQDIDELKNHLTEWQASFDIKNVPGSILYVSFIDFLVNHASDAYLFGLCENFKRR
ncbi:hypothetical protein ACMA1I_23075 [Pontibacter sp. 13R65]|uniref:hypothetical protein n=1 Tax=Pontibacter sp. 13R65 TaxID=3127458 RepID=UPI00301E2033